MQIKEVEKRTGLTAKSIRFYEAKGLIQVGRQSENDYREYTEENVRQLSKIKLLRYLDFSVEEIRELLKENPSEWRANLEKKAASFAKEQQRNQQKQELCLTLAKDGQKDSEKVIGEYQKTIDFLENEGREMQEKLLDISVPSVSSLILETLIFLGPILWLFINIHDKRMDALWLNSWFALGATVALTLIWKRFFHMRKMYRDRAKKKDSKQSHLIPVMILGIVGTLMAFVLFSRGQEAVFCHGNWLFYEINPKMELLVILCLMAPILFFLLFGVSVLRNRRNMAGQMRENMNADEVDMGRENSFSLEGDDSPVSDAYLFFLRYKVPVIAVWLVFLYLCFTSVTVVTEDAIIYHSPLCPQGKSYAYSEVEKVKAAFGSSSVSLLEYKKRGNFSYTVFVDGHDIIFSVPSTNESVSRYEDSYLELEEFDAKLMALGIEKEGDERYAKNCQLDQVYVERFLRIVRNESN